MKRMQTVARMTFEKGKVCVEITNPKLAILEEVVYIWQTPRGKWLRVGTSAAPVKKRLAGYSNYINKALDGKRSATPLSEAKMWKKLLEEHGYLVAKVLQPPYVSTIVGEIRPYLDIERVLIRQNKLELLNRSHR